MLAIGPTRVDKISPRLAASTAPDSDVASQGCATAVGIGARLSHRAKSCSYFPVPGSMTSPPRPPCKLPTLVQIILRHSYNVRVIWNIMRRSCRMLASLPASRMDETAMVKYELLRTEGILVIQPEASLEASDFQKITQEVDPYIEANGKLHGVLIDAKAFPGWKDFAALVAHLKFVKDHHRRIQRVAVVSDSSFLAVAPKVVSHFVAADVRHFPQSQRDEALAWLRGEN